MLRRNQRGSIDFFLYALAAVCVLAFCFFLVIALTQPNKQVKTSTDIEKREATTRGNTVVNRPEDWHTYTNPDTGYSFSYPKEWGAVRQTKTEGDSPTYQYRFTSNEGTTVSQVHPGMGEPVHAEDYLMYNQFTTIGTTVSFCATESCGKSSDLPAGDVRLFATQTGLEAAELTIIDDQDLRLVHIVNTGYQQWPGLVISSVLQADVDTSQTKDDILYDAVTNNYVRNEQLRQFADFIE